jgi:hypothetical protein
MVESGCGVVPIVESDQPEFIFALSPTCDPLDVEPMGGEPNHMEQGIIHNPRDGLLTIVFYADGEEGFVDANANGEYDPGESFAGQDLGEPYVDADDNNQYDPGEQFLDVDENGQWSPADGRWSGETKVWTATHLMFTGLPHESADTTRFQPTGINIENGGDQMLTLYLMDINHNPIASNDDDDAVYFSATGASIISSDELLLHNVMGVEFTGTGSIITESFNQHRTYQVILADPYPTSVDPDNVTLETTVEWTPAPRFNNYSPTLRDHALRNVTGVVE